MKSRARRAITRLITVVIAVIVVAAAGVGAYYVSTQTQPPPIQAVRIARQAPDTPSIMYITVAQQSGFFGQNRINASIKDLPGPPQVLQSLVAGEVDIGAASFTITLGALTRGPPIKVVAITSVAWNFILVAKTKFKSLSDLKGATIAIAARGVGDDIIWDEALKTVGLSLKDVNLVSVGISPRKFEAVVTGRADATALVTEFIPRIQARDDLRILDDKAGTRYFPLPFHAILARTELIEKNPQAVKSVVKSLIQSVRKLQTDEQFFVDQVIRAFGQDYKPEDARIFFRNLQDTGYWGVNGGINLNKLDRAISYYYDKVNPEATRDIVKKGSDIVNTRFVNEVLDELGVVNSPWDVPDWRGRASSNPLGEVFLLLPSQRPSMK